MTLTKREQSEAVLQFAHVITNLSMYLVSDKVYHFFYRITLTFHYINDELLGLLHVITAVLAMQVHR